MKNDVIKPKLFPLIILATLTACGGGNTDADSMQQTTEKIAAAASSAHESTLPTDDLGSINQVSDWLTFDSDQFVSAHLVSSTHLRFLNNQTINTSSGLFVSSDFAQKHWEEIIEPALDIGRIVVIEALSQSDGESAIETLTVKHLGVGVVGKVAMLSKASSGYQVAGFAANEILELTNAMRTAVQKIDLINQ